MCVLRNDRKRYSLIMKLLKLALSSFLLLVPSGTKAQDIVTLKTCYGGTHL